MFFFFLHFFTSHYFIFDIKLQLGQKYNFIDLIKFLCDFNILRNVISELILCICSHVKWNIRRFKIKFVLSFSRHNVRVSLFSGFWRVKILRTLNLGKIEALTALRIFKWLQYVVNLLDRTIIVKSLGFAYESCTTLFVSAHWAFLIVKSRVN